MAIREPVALTCPGCENRTLPGRYDASFRLEDGDPRDSKTEQNLFGLPAALCPDCRQLYLDADLISLLNLREYRCTFAIESDQKLLEGLFPDKRKRKGAA